MNYGSNDTAIRKSCYNFRVVEINRVVDGDTIDVTIDLGFDLYKKRVRVAGVDTPENVQENLEEKALGIDATNLLQRKTGRGGGLVMMILLSVLNLSVALASMVVFLGGYMLGTEICPSMNK